MRYSAFCILLLTISEPLLIHANKVVLVIPQQTRRSMGPSWRPAPTRYRKSSQAGEVYYHRYPSSSGHYHPKKSLYGSPPFPHGGDDFDQGYEHVNHVHVPYGKGISHAISFGKGYVPYDQLKGTFSFGRERNPSSQEQKHPSESEYPATSFTSSDAEYSPTGHSYEPARPETFFPDPESALNYNERRNDRKKFYSPRSIEKDIVVNSPVELDPTMNKDHILLLQQKGPELYKNVVPQPQSSILLPSGIPPATIGGNKDGIVLRDTVALEEYQQKLQEMTKSWPQFLSNAGFGNNFQGQQVTASYSTGVSSPSVFSGSINWPVNFAQPKQGYDVKEDTMEPPHDFRTMPIQTSPYHTFPVPMNVALPTVAQAVHG